MPSIFPWSTSASADSLSRTARGEKRATSRKQSLHKRSWTEDPADPEVVLLDETDIAADICVGEGDNHGTARTNTMDTQTYLSGVTLTADMATDPVFPSQMNVYSAERFKDDSDGIHFFTGLENYLKFMLVLQTLGSAAYELNYLYGAIHHIPVQDQFLLVLMKLRRHMTNFELSRSFGISKADVYNIFCTWIRFMSLQWRELDTWCDRDLVRFYMPSGFKAEFSSTRVIIDGTECPVKKPKLPNAQQSTFSTYKNRNTVKVLAGITPGGLCSYVSPAYGGSTSDRQIVERSTVPQSCDPGDSVMSDKGFNVQDIFAPYNVSVNIPTFFKKQNRMPGKTVLKDRKVASKRVHIERFIGLAKTYKILTIPMNTSETQLSSDILFVCFMLCNFRSGIVPTNA